MNAELSPAAEPGRNGKGSGMSDERTEARAVPDTADGSQETNLQREKLVAEVRRLKVENSPLTRLFTAVLSGSAVVIAACQIYMAYIQNQAENTRAERDAFLKETEVHVREVEGGLKLSQFAIDQRDSLFSPNPGDQVRVVQLVTVLLPDKEAKQILEVVRTTTTQAEVLNQVAVATQSLASKVPPDPAAAPSPPQ